MIGRFCHFYPGYTAMTALAEPWPRFLAMLGQIGPLSAEDDLRALTVAGIGANPGEKGRQFEKFSRTLRKQTGLPNNQRSTVLPGMMPLASFENKPGEIAKIRARQKQAAIELEAQHGRKRTDTTAD